jgi:hypothetical protein
MKDTKKFLRAGGWAALGAVVVSAGGLAVVACSSGSGSGTQADLSDGATTDSTTSDSGENLPGNDAAGGTDSTTGVAADGGGDADASDAGSSADASDAAISDGGGTCEVFDASGLDEAAVAAGFQQVWQVYKCNGCHQNSSQVVDDAGHGIVLSGNNNGLGYPANPNPTAFPPNLTNDPATGLGCWNNQQIQDAILNGLDNEGGALCPSMPLWGHITTKPGTPMDAGTAQEIIAFLRSLPPVVNQVPDTTCVATDAGGGTDAAITDASDGGG